MLWSKAFSLSMRAWLLLLAVVHGASQQQQCPSSFEAPLEAVIYPIKPQEFFQNYHQKRWKHIHQKTRGKAALFQQLWSMPAAEDWLWSQRARWHKQWETKGGRMQVDIAIDGEKQFTSGKLDGRAGLEQVYKSLLQGHSVVMHDLEDHPQIWPFARALGGRLGVSVQLNSYVSPASEHGQPAFHYHWDNSDSFILQCEGRKIWTVCDRQYPLTSESVVRHRRQVGARRCQNITMEEGDSLYLPLGTFHKAFPLPASGSIHLTVAIHNGLASWRSFLYPVLVQLLPNCESEGFDVSGFLEYLWMQDEVYEHLAISRYPEVQMSISNQDLPEDFLEKKLMPLVKRMLKHLRSSYDAHGGDFPGCEALPGLLKVISEYREGLLRLTNDAVENFRHSFVYHMKAHAPRLTLSPMGPESHFQRPANSRVAFGYKQESKGYVLTTTGSTTSIEDEERIRVVEWCLGWHMPQSSRGRVFPFSRIPGDNLGLKIEVLSMLLTKGLLIQVKSG